MDTSIIAAIRDVSEEYTTRVEGWSFRTVNAEPPYGIAEPLDAEEIRIQAQWAEFDRERGFSLFPGVRGATAARMGVELTEEFHVDFDRAIAWLNSAFESDEF